MRSETGVPMADQRGPLSDLVGPLSGNRTPGQAKGPPVRLSVLPIRSRGSYQAEEPPFKPKGALCQVKAALCQAM